MARAAFLLLLALAGTSASASAREAVYASAPGKVSVTVYRDPNRGEDQRINRDWPQGFAVISDTRTVTLPPGESTIRFEGVSEGMVAVSAIVTGLPGGTIEKNRNADLLSPASLVDGTLGNRVTITRTNPATGKQVSQDAIVRTRADGGLVLQTQDGFEAVRCSGLPETLGFNRVPDGLSAQPVFSVDTRDAAGGTYQVELTYISSGFDWQADYIATRTGKGRDGKERFRLLSWLTLVNDNNQSFDDAGLLVVAGKLNIDSDFRSLASPPEARSLSLSCYPLGSTAAGSPIETWLPPPPAPPPPGAYDDSIVVTAQFRSAPLMSAPMAVTSVSGEMLAKEEALGDLKLYRVPGAVNVSAKSMKQVAFLDKDDMKGAFQHRFNCLPGWDNRTEATPLRVWLRTKNDKKNGLGAALPMGGVAVFEPSAFGDQLVAEASMRDYAVDRDVDLELGDSPNVFGLCVKDSDIQPYGNGYPWVPMHTTVTNANPYPVSVRVQLGSPAQWKIRGAGKGLAQNDGQWTIEQVVPANGSAKIVWEQRSSAGVD